MSNKKKCWFDKFEWVKFQVCLLIEPVESPQIGKVKSWIVLNFKVFNLKSYLVSIQLAMLIE